MRGSPPFGLFPILNTTYSAISPPKYLNCSHAFPIKVLNVLIHCLPSLTVCHSHMPYIPAHRVYFLVIYHTSHVSQHMLTFFLELPVYHLLIAELIPAHSPGFSSNITHSKLVIYILITSIIIK